jgi:hypothetical protein
MNLDMLKAMIKKNPDMGFGFWENKARIEKSGNHHLLDDKHFTETRDILLNEIPKWQTYRYVYCNWRMELPKSLKNIINSYEQIRNYSLLDFDKVPERPLNKIWHELGRVKEDWPGNKNPEGIYYVIAICKPLLFLWGQTPSLDSINRKKIKASLRPNSFLKIPGTRWSFSDWYELMLFLQRQLKNNPETISYCEKTFNKGLSQKSLIPWGRFLDIYYYEKEKQGV